MFHDIFIALFSVFFIAHIFGKFPPNFSRKVPLFFQKFPQISQHTTLDVTLTYDVAYMVQQVYHCTGGAFRGPKGKLLTINLLYELQRS